MMIYLISSSYLRNRSLKGREISHGHFCFLKKTSSGCRLHLQGNGELGAHEVVLQMLRSWVASLVSASCFAIGSSHYKQSKTNSPTDRVSSGEWQTPSANAGSLLST
jgi:hypothetical protein